MVYAWASNPIKEQRAIDNLKKQWRVTNPLSKKAAPEPTEEAIKAEYIKYGGLIIEVEAPVEKAEE